MSTHTRLEANPWWEVDLGEPRPVDRVLLWNRTDGRLQARLGGCRVLLLDEPSLGLAPMLVSQVFETIQEINGLGTTVLLVEQNALQALSIAHRAYVLQTGRVVLSGPAAEVKENESVRKAYLGED